MRSGISGDDLSTLGNVDDQLVLYQQDLTRGFDLRMAEIDRVLVELESRGRDYFDDTLRIGRIFDLLNRSRIQHEFEQLKPLIFYADHPDFQQTNVVGGFIDQSTGGITESLLRLSAVLVEEYDGQVPGRLVDLVRLPGVGRKTANVVLGNAFDVPGITVDTHVGRLARRLGWSTSKDAVKVKRDIAALVPPERWTMLCHRLIFHGRRVCHSRRPACGACVLAELCPSYGTGETDPEAAEALVRRP